MSNSIWKTPDQKPEDGSEILFMIGENHCVGYYDKHSGLYVEPKRFYDTEYAPDEIDRWIYADDLIAQADKAERLQKAVDVAVNALKDCEKILKADRKDWGYLTAHIALNKIEALAEITALEQKENQ